MIEWYVWKIERGMKNQLFDSDWSSQSRNKLYCFHIHSNNGKYVYEKKTFTRKTIVVDRFSIKVFLSNF